MWEGIRLQSDFHQNKDSNWLSGTQSSVSSGLQSNFQQNKDSNEPPGKRNPV